MTDLTPADSAPAVPIVPAASAPVVAVPAADGTLVPLAGAPVRRSRGLGTFALILGLLAFIGDIVVIVVAVVQLVGLISNFDVSQLFTSPNMAAFGGLIVLALVAFWGGIIVGGLAVLLGLIAAITGRGRAQGVVGVIFGLLVVITHLVIAFGLLNAGSGISNLGS